MSVSESYINMLVEYDLNKLPRIKKMWKNPVFIQRLKEKRDVLVAKIQELMSSPGENKDKLGDLQSQLQRCDDRLKNALA